MVPGILRRLAHAPLASSGSEGSRDLTSEEWPANGNGPFSLAAVYEAHFHYVWRSLRGFGVEAQALDDAVHEVFLVVQRKLPEFDGERAEVTTWLYEIALRIAQRCRAHSAREARRYVALGPTPEEHTEPSAAVSDLRVEIDHAEQLAVAHLALEALDDEKRQVFVLAFVEQRTAPEIASITGAPLNTVYSRMRAAKRLFAEEVERLASNPCPLPTTRGR